MKNIHKKIGLIFFGICCGLIIAISLLQSWKLFKFRKLSNKELTKVITAWDNNPQSIFKYDSDISYMLKPNIIGPRYKNTNYIHRTNSRSLLGAEEITTNPDTKKILFLGDSVTYGENLDYKQTFVPLLQKQAGKQFQFSNGSCPAWSTKQEIKFYEKYLSDIKWDAIVLVFFPNDLVNYQLINRKSDNDVSIDNISSKDYFTYAPQLMYLKQKFSQNSKTKILSEEMDYILMAWVDSAFNKYLSQTLLPFVKKYRDIPLIIVAVPSYLQIYMRTTLDTPQNIAYFPQNKLKTFCEEQNVPFIDCAKSLENILIKSTKLYIDSQHLSVTGHKVTAYYLWPNLKKHIEND